MRDYFGKLNQKQKDSLNIILRNTNHLDLIIQDFLEISRIESARLKFNFMEIELTNPINSLVKEMNNFMPEKKIKIVTQLGTLPLMEVDPERVIQIIRNLTQNAIKFSPENSTIKISASVVNKMLQISVADQGIGIKKEDQEKLFEPFFQAEQTIYKRKAGTGLGLAISKGIVEAQEGKIWLESQVEKGTTFFFTIPLTPVKEIKSIKLLFSSEKEPAKK
jgi:signal transduction histidine kinase